MTHFNIFVAAYNAEPWIKRCIDTIRGQNYQDYTVTLVNDASTDRTGAVMSKFVSDSDRAFLFINTTNQKKPYNLATYARAGDPEDVIVVLDGDDYFPNAHVLNTLALVYTDPGIWLTYGSYTRTPDPSFMPNPARPIPLNVIRSPDFRTSPYAYHHNHLRTFKRWLFNRVEDWELQDESGAWFTCADDHAVMLPMLEMAGTHSSFLSDVLYVYNEDNPSSDAKIRVAELARVHAIINGRPPRAAI